jgi:SAM-dependent methyltransferase
VVPGAILSQEATEFLREAELLGAERALGRRVPFEEYDPARADWRFLLPLRSSSKILQVGSDWGTIATALAVDVELVVAVTQSIEEARFLEIRAAQSGFDNIVPVVAPADALPVPFASFDGAVLSRPLALGSNGGGPARDLRLLRSLRSKLRPGGFLFSGAVNRYGFADLTPSAAAIVGALVASRRDERAGSSMRGYRRVLKSAGFARAEFFATLPTFHHPRAIFSLESRSPCEFFLSRVASAARATRLRTSLVHLACRMGLASHLIPQYGVLAWNRS